MARKRQCSSSSASMAPPPPQPKVAATNNAPSSNQTKNYRQSELPHDLILEILPRLPVKSLLRFRCVCKTWDSLLYDPRFLKKHVSLARHRLLVNSRPIFLNSFQASNLLLDQPYTNSQVLRFPTNRKQYVRIIGSCYGLVCLKVFNRGNEAIYFWNPSTKQSIKLPYTCDVRECNIYGFGFADSTNEFKLVRVYIQSLNGWRRFSVEIFGMLDGSRRHLGIFPHGFPYTRTEGIFLNGAIHIVSVKSEKLLVDGVIITHTVWFIVALDLETETFRLLPQPDFVDDQEAFKCEEKSLSLYSVGELLCAVRSYKGSHGDVWVLKEYGVKESWVKLVRIPFLQVPRDNVDDWKPKPVYYSEKSGELLMIIRDDELVLYNANDNSFREIRLPGVNMKSKFYTQIKNHVDSLFAPGVMMRLRGETSHQNQQG